MAAATAAPWGDHHDDAALVARPPCSRLGSRSRRARTRSGVTGKVVGTDIVHAVPLTLLAGLGHFWMGHVDLMLLGSLLLGSIPGIVIGSRLTGMINPAYLRTALAAMLLLSGIRLLG